MTLSEITRNFVRTITSYFESSHIHRDKSAFRPCTDIVLHSFLQHAHHEGACSQNAVFLQDLLRRVCDPKLPYTVAN